MRTTFSSSVATMGLLTQHDGYEQSLMSPGGWMGPSLPLCCLQKTLSGTQILDSPSLHWSAPVYQSSIRAAPVAASWQDDHQCLCRN